MMYCKYCGTEMDSSAKFCKSCGQPLESGQMSPRVADDSSQCPSNHIFMAVLVTLFCCLPFGIVSIIYSSKVDQAWRDGFPEMAKTYSRKARNWALWGFIPSLILYILCIVAMMIGVACGLDVCSPGTFV